MDESMSGEPMALNIINEMNGQVKFLYRKSSFLALLTLKFVFRNFKCVNNVCLYIKKEFIEYASHGSVSSRNNHAIFLFENLTWGRKVSHELFLSMEQITNFNEKKHYFKYVQA